MIEAIRAPLLGEPLVASTFWYLGVMTVVGWALAWLLYRRYARFVPLWV
jgi:ABC-type polysaccharide/polyol phosphate export permease